MLSFPHCDSRVLHAPSECEFCDAHPEWQELRQSWGVAYSGHPATIIQPLPCPADWAVARGERGDYNLWGGNVPQPKGTDG